MIDCLFGYADEINEKYVVFWVNSVGYALNCSANTIQDLSQSKDEVKVYTYLSATDSGISLYGFSTKAERELFFSLTSVSKVGPRVALNILSAFSPEQLARVIGSGDVKALSTANGVGKKTAESIIFNLKGVFEAAAMADGGAETGPSDKKQEAVWALNALGFDNAYALMLVNAVYDPGLCCEDIIKEALKISNK
jgi:Holliday junction DNA helicase RuvA